MIQRKLFSDLYLAEFLNITTKNYILYYNIQ